MNTLTILLLVVIAILVAIVIFFVAAIHSLTNALGAALTQFTKR